MFPIKSYKFPTYFVTLSPSPAPHYLSMLDIKETIKPCRQLFIYTETITTQFSLRLVTIRSKQIWRRNQHKSAQSFERKKWLRWEVFGSRLLPFRVNLSISREGTDEVISFDFTWVLNKGYQTKFYVFICFRSFGWFLSTRVYVYTL